jgi:serine/threonine protein kinase
MESELNSFLESELTVAKLEKLLNPAILNNPRMLELVRQKLRKRRYYRMCGVCRSAKVRVEDPEHEEDVMVECNLCRQTTLHIIVGISPFSSIAIRPYAREQIIHAPRAMPNFRDSALSNDADARFSIQSRSAQATNLAPVETTFDDNPLKVFTERFKTIPSTVFVGRPDAPDAVFRDDFRREKYGKPTYLVSSKFTFGKLICKMVPAHKEFEKGFKLEGGKPTFGSANGRVIQLADGFDIKIGTQLGNGTGGNVYEVIDQQNQKYALKMATAVASRKLRIIDSPDRSDVINFDLSNETMFASEYQVLRNVIRAYQKPIDGLVIPLTIFIIYHARTESEDPHVLLRQHPQLTFCIMMPLLGPSLYQHINKVSSRGLDMHTRYEIARRAVFCVAKALAPLAEGPALNFIHADLKPENLLLEQGFRHGIPNEIQIADFGLSSTGSGDYEAMTMIFRAPEVWACTGKHKPASNFGGVSVYEEPVKRIKWGTPVDVWALGLIVLDILNVLVGLLDYDTNWTPEQFMHKIFDIFGHPTGELADHPYGRSWTGRFRSQFVGQSPYPVPEFYQTHLNRRIRPGILNTEHEVEHFKWVMNTIRGEHNLYDLLKKMLCVNPNDRIKMSGVLAHPFLARSS